ncbi:MAG: hypothetical protein DMF20_06895 [Verrucomicrobia bacterium]|nr:MAG: hypothetical protein DMF20_06895 [Verrucomicrobiota bacterium]
MPTSHLLSNHLTVKSLRIGCVKYLNARPLIHGWGGDVDFDHPSALCNKLAAGNLDVALVSSFEFLRNPIYRIVDDVSISSDGPVYSVVVARRGEVAEIEEIELDPASETSANLLRCLIEECGLNPHLVQHSTARRASVAELKLVGLPFVYALWLIRPEVADPEQIANRLRALRDENLTHLDDVIEDIVAGGGDPGWRRQFNREFLSRYYRQHLRFTFGEKEKEGLLVFADLCERRSLLPKRDLTFRVV